MLFYIYIDSVEIWRTYLISKILPIYLLTPKSTFYLFVNTEKYFLFICKFRKCMCGLSIFILIKIVMHKIILIVGIVIGPKL